MTAELDAAIEAYENTVQAGWISPLVALAAFNLDFLCIHVQVLNATEGKFTLRDIEWKCPGVSRETIKSVLKSYPSCFVCEGRGVAARWLKVKNVVENKADGHFGG